MIKATIFFWFPVLPLPYRERVAVQNSCGQSADKLACRRCCGRTDVLPEASRVAGAGRSHSFCMVLCLLLGRRRLVLANVVCVVAKAKWRFERRVYEFDSFALGIQ